MAKELVKGKDYFVIHTMRDGRVLDSIDGYKVPINEKTKIVYDLLANEYIKSCQKRVCGKSCVGKI